MLGHVFYCENDISFLALGNRWTTQKFLRENNPDSSEVIQHRPVWLSLPQHPSPWPRDSLGRSPNLQNTAADDNYTWRAANTPNTYEVLLSRSSLRTWRWTSQAGQPIHRTSQAKEIPQTSVSWTLFAPETSNFKKPSDPDEKCCVSFTCRLGKYPTLLQVTVVDQVSGPIDRRHASLMRGYHAWLPHLMISRSHLDVYRQVIHNNLLNINIDHSVPYIQL